MATPPISQGQIVKPVITTLVKFCLFVCFLLLVVGRRLKDYIGSVIGINMQISQAMVNFSRK
jgi:hypothetical protein